MTKRVFEATANAVVKRGGPAGFAVTLEGACVDGPASAMRLTLTAPVGIAQEAEFCTEKGVKIGIVDHVQWEGKKFRVTVEPLQEKDETPRLPREKHLVKVLVGHVVRWRGPGGKLDGTWLRAYEDGARWTANPKEAIVFDTFDEARKYTFAPNRYGDRQVTLSAGGPPGPAFKPRFRWMSPDKVWVAAFRDQDRERPGPESWWRNDGKRTPSGMRGDYGWGPLKDAKLFPSAEAAMKELFASGMYPSYEGNAKPNCGIEFCTLAEARAR